MKISNIYGKQWLLIGLLALLTHAGLASEKPSRPDVVFILLDDLRWDAMSFLGHPYIETPNIDKLRQEGAYMENAFVTTSICCPSRATFLTGTYANRHGVIDNETSEYNPEITPPLTKYLQEAGYKTAMIGKWHMGKDARPRAYFDYWLSFKGQGVYHDPVFNINGENQTFYGYTTDLLTDKAIEFIEKQPEDQPYFVVLSHKAVHEPFRPAQRHKAAYGADTELPEPASWVDDFQNKPEWMRRQQIRDYRWEWRTRELEADQLLDTIPLQAWEKNTRYVNQLRCAAAVDEGIGRLMESLKKRGNLENTLIIFTSDNGYFHMEHRRWDKRLAYEESLRIPMLVMYPGKIEAGSTSAGLVTNLDFAPTVLDYAGAEIPEQMQGRSMRPLFDPANTEWRDSIFYEYWTDLVHSIPTMIAVRTDRHKLICYPELDDIDELYDLSKDPHEMHNLAGKAENETLHREMQQELLKQIEETGWKANVFPKNLPRLRETEGLQLELEVAEGKIIDRANSGLPIRPLNVEVGEDALHFKADKQGLKVAYDESIDPAYWPYSIEINVKADEDGVIASHSGPKSGYKIFVQDGRPGIAVVCRTWIATRTTIDAPESILGKWTQLKAVIDYNRLIFSVDGEVVDSVPLPQPFKYATGRPLIIGAGGAQAVNPKVPHNPLVGAVKAVVVKREL